MKKWFTVLLGAVIALTTAASSENMSEETHDFSYALERAGERREGIVKPDYSIFLAMTEGRTPIPGHPEGFWGEDVPSSPLLRISLEYAVSDAWTLFNLMRDVYGGYVYFGGDEVFYAVFENITEELTALGQDIILTSHFVNIVHENLSQIIVDNHFWLGNHRMGRDIAFFQPVNMRHSSYRRTGSGFINKETGLALYEIVGHEIEDVMRLFADEGGELFYAPVLLLENFRMPLTQIRFMYEDGTGQLRSFRRKVQQARRTQLPSLEFIDGIPVVTVMMMGFDGHENAWNVDHAVPFLSFAEELRDEPVVVVDIRSNGGGNGLMGQRWLYELTGEIVPTNSVNLSTWPYESGRFAFDPYNPFQNLPGSIDGFIFEGPFGEGYSISNHLPREVIEREQILILITDRFAGSAAESFADLAFNITNTLVIGAPTAGVLAFDLTYPQLTLPNTGVPFGLGRNMFLWPDGHFAEGVGIQPDIWVEGDALEAALALIRNGLLAGE